MRPGERQSGCDQTNADDAETAATGTANKSAGETVSEATESVGEAVTETQRVTSDSWITTKIKSKLYSDSLSQGYEVDVKTLHGAVALTGTVESQAAIDDLEIVATKVKGVKSVDTSDLNVQ